MSYTLIDYFKAFHSLKERLKLSAGSQAVYFSILGEFNAAHYPERLSFSYRELKALAGLKSVSTTYECVNVLKNKKLIEFETDSDGLVYYQLLTEHLPNGNRTLTEHLPNGLARSNIRVREDVKTFSSPPPPACACDTSELELLIEYWDGELHGGRLIPEAQSQIEVWLAHHKFEWVKEVMREAALANGKRQGVDFKFLQKCVERKENAETRPTLKGGGKSGTSGEMHYAEPEESGIDLTAY